MTAPGVPQTAPKVAFVGPGRVGRSLAFAIGQLWQHDVFACRKFGQQVVELIDKTDFVTAHGSAFSVRQCGHIATRNRDRACVGRIKQPRYMQQRRFARPRGGNEGHDLAPFHRKTDTMQHVHLIGFSVVIGLGDALHFESVIIHSAGPQLGSCGRRGARERW